MWRPAFADQGRAMATDTEPARGMNALAGLSALGFVVLVVLAGIAVHGYHAYTGDDPLIGLSMLFAFAAGGIALLGGSLTLAGWLLRRRRPSLAQGLAIAGTVVLVLPFAGSGLSVVLGPFL